MKSLRVPFLGVLLGSIGLGGLTLVAQPVPPQVSNLRVSQRPGTFYVDIWYDLIDPDSDQVRVELELSGDGGATYNLPAISLKGDVGIIAPGRNKHIEWNAWDDWAGNFTIRGRARVTAEDTKTVVFPPPFPAPRPELVWIPPGTFTMGSPSTEKDRQDDEGPQTQVYLSTGFFMSKYETTQEEYQAVIGTNPSKFKGDVKRPVDQVSWGDATNYCAKLTEGERVAGRLPAGYVYRLPTEAEWEYACRAGTTTRFSYGDDLNYGRLGDYAWYDRNSGSTTHPVGTRLPNPWGLYDLSGNVWEWCSDLSGSYPGGSKTDWAGPSAGLYRVLRGGSWRYPGGWSDSRRECRSAHRGFNNPAFGDFNDGFRVVLAPRQP